MKILLTLIWTKNGGKVQLGIIVFFNNIRFSNYSNMVLAHIGNTQYYVARMLHDHWMNNSLENVY